MSDMIFTKTLEIRGSSNNIPNLKNLETEYSDSKSHAEGVDRTITQPTALKIPSHPIPYFYLRNHIFCTKGADSSHDLGSDPSTPTC